MKNFCKFLCGAISMLVLSCSENIDTIGNSNVNGVVSKDEKVSMEIYGSLDDSFISGTRTGEGFIYPDYYGGSYIDDNGGLIILTTDSVESVVKDLRFRTKSSNFSIKNCEYSLNELQSLNEELGKVFENQNIASELKWVSVGIDIVHNKVSVDLEDCSESIIVKFKSMVSNSSMIKFNEVAPIIFDSGYEKIQAESISSMTKRAVKTNVHLGSPYSSRGKNQQGDPVRFVGSVGCRAMHGTEHGFVTAAHCLPKMGLSVCIGETDTNLGKVTSVKLNASSDAAFVAVDYDKYYPTNTTYRTKTALYDKILKNSSLVGYEVSTEGQKTANVVKAKVTEINKKVHVQKWTPAGQADFYANNMVYATFTSSQTQEGDSGGIVYVNGYVAGIHSARLGNTTQIFSSAELVLKDLGLTNIWEK